MPARLSHLLPVGLAHELAGDYVSITAPSSPWVRLAMDFAELLITVLQVGQFVPQHVEMFQERSTAGLSPWLIFFGSMYTVLAFVDVALSSVATPCDGAFRCFIATQPYIQMLLSAALSSALWYWYLRFDADIPVSAAEADLESSSFANTFYRKLPAVHFFRANVVLVAGVALAAALVARSGDEERVTHFAHACGIASAGLNAVMWMPQIIVTAAFGHKGALSLYWVIASVVMDVVYSVYLAVLGYDVSVWLNNVPDAIQTSILFCIIMYVERKAAAGGSDEFGRRKSMMERLRRGSGGEDRRAETLALLRQKPENGYSAIPYVADV